MQIVFICYDERSVVILYHPRGTTIFTLIWIQSLSFEYKPVSSFPHSRVWELSVMEKNKTKNICSPEWWRICVSALVLSVRCWNLIILGVYGYTEWRWRKVIFFCIFAFSHHNTTIKCPLCWLWVSAFILEVVFTFSLLVLTLDISLRHDCCDITSGNQCVPLQKLQYTIILQQT